MESNPNLQIETINNLIASEKYHDAENRILDLLESIISKHLEKPKEITEEYQIIDNLFFYYNLLISPELLKNTPLQDKFPTNSFLLLCSEKPEELNAIIFQMFCHLHPEDPADYSGKEILDAIKKYRENGNTGFSPHSFEYMESITHEVKSTVIIKLKNKDTSIETTHILSY